MAPIDVNDDTKNWLKVGLALKHLKNGILQFVSHHITTLHASIISHRGTCTTCTTENVLPCPTSGMCRFKHKRCQYHDQAYPQKQTRLCPTGVCKNISGDIETNHVFGRPNWKNTDATKWATNQWEMAKCFLPPGYAGVTSALETDCTAILSLCLNCRPLEVAITPVKGLVEQNRTNRNEVMHSGSQELTATERGAYIQDAIDLLTRYQTPIDQNTQTCIDTLTELNTDGFMLTTDDFSNVILDAVDAIRQQQETIQDELESGRTAADENKDSIEKLQAGKVDQETYMKKVTEMEQNLKSIYPKVQLLYESNQTELRKRMESIRKGIETMKADIWKHIQTIEDDMKQLYDDMEQVKQVQKSDAEKRKRQGKELDEVKSKIAKQEEMGTSLEMEIGVVKSGILNLEGKVDEIQEHNKQHAIKENNSVNVQKQDRERLRAHLVNLYTKTCSKMPVAPPKRNMLADIKEHYREQDMKQVEMPHEPKSDRKGQANSLVKGKPKGNQEVHKRTDIKSYYDIFNRNGQKCQNIYIKGEAGSGKSVFCQNMVNKWCDIISPGAQDDGKTDDEVASNHHTIDQSDDQARSSSEGKKHSKSRQTHNDWFYVGLLSTDQDKIDELNTSSLRKFEYLFHLKLRFATECRDIISMIIETLLMDNDDLAKALRDVLKHEPEKCLVLLDGLDEWAPPKGSRAAPHVTRGLPGRNITTNWTVLTTTRPWKLELIRPESAEMDQLVELSGFTQYSAKQCIESVIASLNKRYDKCKIARECQDYLSQNDIECVMTLPELRRTGKFKHLIMLPVLLKHLVCIWFDEGQIGDSQCDIYAGMVDVYLRYSAQRQENLNSLTFPHSFSLPSCLNNRITCKKYTHQLYSLGKLAFYTLFCKDRTSSLVFNSTATEHHGMSEDETDMWLNVGLLSQDIVDIGGAAEHKKLSFPHKSIQEFLAAVYISVCEDENTTQHVVEMCLSVKMVMEMSQVFVFVAGMNPSAFTKISKHIADIASRDEKVQEYRTSTAPYESHVRAIQELALSCIEESKANDHEDHIEIHIHDIVLGNRPITLGIINLEDTIELQLEMIKMNKADVVSLTLDHAIYLLNIFGEASVQRFENLRTIKIFNTDIALVTYFLERSQTTLEKLSLKYNERRSPYDLREVELSVFSRLAHLHAIHLSSLKLNYHHINQTLSHTQHIELKEVVIDNLDCSPCIQRCMSCCENQFDLSRNALLQQIQLSDLVLKGVDSAFTKQTARTGNKPFVNQNAVLIDATQMESCIITNITLIPHGNTFDKRPRGCTVTFINTPTPCMNLELARVSLQHGQLLKLLSDTTSLKHIRLSELRCLDCDSICNVSLCLLEHTQLETLVLNEVKFGRLSPADTNVRFNKLQVNTVHLQHCSVNNGPHCHEGYISTMEFIGASEKLRRFNLSDIALKHDQFEGVITFLSRATRLEEITLSELSCVDHGNACECCLDMTTHTTLRELLLKDVHGCALRGTIATNPNLRPGNTCMNWGTVELYNIHTTVLQIDTDYLKLDKLHVNELTVHTTRLEKCTINDLSTNGSESRHPDSPLSIFEFVGTAESLCWDLTLSNMALTHGQLQSVMSFLTRATHLRKITLSELRCVEHGDTCECQLDLVEHEHIEILKLNRAHVNSWIKKVDPVEEPWPWYTLYEESGMQMVGVYANVAQIKIDRLKVDKSRINELTVDTTQLKKTEHIKRFGVFASVDIVELHAKAVQFSTDSLKLHKSRIDTLKVETAQRKKVERSEQAWFCDTYKYRVDIMELHANVVQIKTDSLKLYKLHINCLKVDTTQLEKCTITDVFTNDSKSHQYDSAQPAFELQGTAQNLESLTISNIALKHDQLQGVMSFVTRATRLWEITLSELRCVDHGSACESQLDLAEHNFILKIKLHRVHVNILKLRSIKQSLDHFGKFGSIPPYKTDSVDIVELHANAVQISTDSLKLDMSHVTELFVDTTKLVTCSITNVSSNNNESPLSTFQLHGKTEHLKHLELRNINLHHDQFEEIMSIVTRTTRLRKIFLSDLQCVDHADHDSMCACQLNLMDHKQLHTLEIDKLHVSQVQVNAARLECCKLTNLKASSICIISCDSLVSVNLPKGKGRFCKRLVVGNVRLTNEQLDGLVTFVTQNKGRCKISLYEIECSECDGECSRIDKLQQLVQFGEPDDEHAITLDTDDTGDAAGSIYSITGAICGGSGDGAGAKGGDSGSGGGRSGVWDDGSGGGGDCDDVEGGYSRPRESKNFEYDLPSILDML